MTEIELDVQELKCLMKSFAQEPTFILAELLKRNIAQLKGRLGQLSEVVDSAQLLCPPPAPETPRADEPKGKDPVFIVTRPESDEMVEAEKPEEKEEEHGAEEVNGEEQSDAPEVKPAEEERKHAAVLGESLNAHTGGLRRFISLNDSFRFSRELFGGDSELMNRVIEQVSAMSSCEAAIAFITSKMKVSAEDEIAAEFVELIRKYFNQSA